MLLDFNDFLCALKDVSYDSSNNVSMCNSSFKVINYDAFQQAIFDFYNKEVCCSLDALIKKDDEWYFVEFKNGQFKNNEISEKVGHSIATFLININESITYVQNNVNFILVYSKNACRQNNKLKKNEYQISEERNKLKENFPGIEKKLVFFKMSKYEKIYFKEVFTYTKEEFNNFVETHLKQSSI